MELIVDLQGFQTSSRKFIVKEIATIATAYSDENAKPHTVLMSPPTCCYKHIVAEFLPMNQWLTNNFHGIQWDAGDVPFQQMEETFFEAVEFAKKLYVKGAEKKLYIKKLLPGMKVIDLADYGCPPLHKLCSKSFIDCPHHTETNNPVCAKLNVEVLAKWLEEYWQ